MWVKKMAGDFEGWKEGGRGEGKSTKQTGALDRMRNLLP
jgi:hypothetical protein